MISKGVLGILITKLFLYGILITHEAMADTAREPVIFLPGILGSRLVDGNGDPAWDGNIWFTDTYDLEKLHLQSGIDLHADGLIENDFSVFGFLKSGPYEPAVECLEEDGYRLDRDLFIFPYDWRRSNFDTALDLSNYIESLGFSNSDSITLIGHSMGGLVGLIYLHRFANRNRHVKLITVGTPFLGSLNAVHMLFSGPWEISNYIGLNARETALTIGSFASLYELTPIHHGCCQENADGAYSAIDLTDYREWLRLNILPIEFSQEPRLSALKDAIERRKTIAEFSTKPLPKQTSVVQIANDFLLTLERLVAVGYPDDYIWSRGPKGDGTVVTESALNGGSRIAVSVTQNHSELFASTRICKEIVNALHEGDELPEQETMRIRDSWGDWREVGALEYDTGSPYKGLGDDAWVRVGVYDGYGRHITGLKLDGYVKDAVGGESDLNFVQEEGAYTARFVVPRHRGIHKVVTAVPQLGVVSDHYLAVDRPKPEREPPSGRGGNIRSGYVPSS